MSEQQWRLGCTYTSADRLTHLTEIREDGPHGASRLVCTATPEDARRIVEAVNGSADCAALEARMATTVVNIMAKQPYDLYIGRAAPRQRLSGSKWANPFKIGVHGDRATVIEKYRQYVLSSPDLMAALPELRDKVLACWCWPAACHGAVLADLADTAAPVVGASDGE